ncbi:MAG: 50S ribosomal protein L11 methyltransferase [Candidatus Omnitrophica bacterium]|nr:50S ribosomal protein L11 methyltransferase [Candidatus Omnitrophota bacterium]
MTTKTIKYPASVDKTKIMQYVQPPAGNTERHISVQPLIVTSGVTSSFECLKNYYIRDFGRGPEAAQRVIEMIFRKKFKKTMNWKHNLWQKTVALTVKCRLRSSQTGELFSTSKPCSFEDINRVYAQAVEEPRKKDAYQYVQNIRSGKNMGFPLYVSGAVLNYLGAGVDENTMYMLDGTRRIMAHALAHRQYITIMLLIFENEFSPLIDTYTINAVKKGIAELSWFKNYQSIPLLGLKGQRSLRRFDLIDMSLLRDQVVMDFGCNVGQASIRAIQAGAQKVIGIDNMPDTIRIAKDIKKIMGLTAVQYYKIDFNSSKFNLIIDKKFPGKADYSFFFSLYRTKELTQRERLFRYCISKTKKGIFFEGHANEKIDTMEYYDWLFETFHLKHEFLGWGEETIRPLYFIPLQQ